jgi:hypothetical protein
MPHISPAAVDHFVQTVALLDVHFGATFNYIGPSVNLALGRTFRPQRVRCHETLLFPKVLSLAWRTLEGSASGDAISSVWLDWFKRQYVYGAMRFTAVDVDDEPLAVFLQETTEHRLLCPRPVLLNHQFSCKPHVMQEIPSQASVHLTGFLGLRIVESVAALLIVQSDNKS